MNIGMSSFGWVLATTFAFFLLDAQASLFAQSAPASQAAATSRPAPQRTFLQTVGGYNPVFDVKSDVILLVDSGRSFPNYARSWQQHGYVVRAFHALMRSNPHDFADVAAIAQEFGNGDKLDRGRGFEIIPTPEYIQSLQKIMRIYVDTPGVTAIELEEPEFVGWRGQTGYGEVFKKEHAAYYNEPWQDPLSSPQALYRSNKLKYHLVHRAIAGAFGYAKQRARENGRDIECVIAAHSLMSWLHDATVGPFASLCDEPFMNAYHVQVWTMTGGVENVYQGLRKDRPFETEYLEYAETANLLRPTKIRFEIDNEPLGDEGDLSWITWKGRWEPGTVASLMFPEAKGYRVLVWPNRQFTDRYLRPTPESIRRFKRSNQPAERFDASVERQPLPREYNTESLVVLHAINDVFDQKDFSFDSGPAGVGVIVSDAMMFQRKSPDTAAGDESNFYGLTLPLLKRGLRVEPVRLEHTARPGFLDGYKVLLCEYESQKPQKPEYDLGLAQWVKNGGTLVMFGDGKSEFNAVPEWWNQGPTKYGSPREHLFEALGLGRTPAPGVHKCEKGYAVIDLRAPESFVANVQSADALAALVREAFGRVGAEYWEQNYFRVDRGPYVMVKVFDEVRDTMPVIVEGRLIDLFDPRLTVHRRKVLLPGESAFLYDIDKSGKSAPCVLASAGKTEVKKADAHTFSFVSSSATGTRGATRLLLPAEPTALTVRTTDGKDHEFRKSWDPASGTLLLDYENLAPGVTIDVAW